MKQYLLDIQAFASNVLIYLRTFWKNHKIIGSIIIIVVIWGGYTFYGKLTSTAGETRYVVTTAQKGTIIVTVSGTGQVASSNQVDIKSQASGDVIRVSAINGQIVNKGAPLLQIDSTDALKSVRDAKIALDSAELSFQKLKQPADLLTITQAENSLAQAIQSKTNAEANLQSAYDNGFNDVSSTFLDLPGIMTGLNDILYGNELDRYVQNVYKYGGMAGGDSRTISYQQDFISSYQKALTLYNSTMAEYKATSRSDATSSIDTLINDTYDTSKAIADAVKSGNNFLNLVNSTLSDGNLTVPSILTTHQNNLNSYTGKTSSDLSSLLSVENTIRSSNDSITNAIGSIKVQSASLDNIKNGADPLDIQSSQLSVTQKQNALNDAQQNLSNYYMTSPMDGTVAKVYFKPLDSVSSGSTVVTLITNQNTASITLNEVDIAKIKIGQKATLTFDAVDGLTITGTVIDMDTIGTVSQGVVSYGVKIGFDTSDPEVKPGMSVSANIITNVKTDALLVPNSAVSGNFVEVFNPPLVESSTSTQQGIASKLPPQRKSVTVGLSDDTNTEIISGLNEGDQVVSRTIAPTTVVKAAAPSLIGGGGGGGGTRAIRGN